MIQVAEGARECEEQGSYLALYGNNKEAAEALLNRASELRQREKQLVIIFFFIFVFVT